MMTIPLDLSGWHVFLSCCGSLVCAPVGSKDHYNKSCPARQQSLQVSVCVCVYIYIYRKIHFKYYVQ